MTTMETEYVKLIAELDKVLDTLRGFWMEAKNDEERKKWRLRLDQSLDESIRLMKCRDAGKVVGV